MKKENGVTLVSLAVTIVVLIILAGVSINAILGENGIITITKQAKENIEQAQKDEQNKLNELYMKLESESVTSGAISYDAIAKLVEFKKSIANAITNKGIATSENDSIDTMVNNIENIGNIGNNITVIGEFSHSLNGRTTINIPENIELIYVSISSSSTYSHNTVLFEGSAYIETLSNNQISKNMYQNHFISTFNNYIIKVNSSGGEFVVNTSNDQSSYYCSAGTVYAITKGS